MNKKCSICLNPKRSSINKEIQKGTALSVIARNFGISYDALYQHSKGCVIKTGEQAEEKLEMIEKFNVLGNAEKLLGESLKMFEDAKITGTTRDLLNIQDSIRKNLLLIDKIYSERKESERMKLETQKLQNKEKDWELTMRWEYGVGSLTDEELDVYAHCTRKIIAKGKEWKPEFKNHIINDTHIPTKDWFPGFDGPKDSQEKQ